MFPGSNVIKEILTSKITYCPKWLLSLILLVDGWRLTHCVLAKLAPSTNSLNSVQFRMCFLFGQAVAKNQMKAVVSGYSFQEGLHCGRT